MNGCSRVDVHVIHKELTVVYVVTAITEKFRPAVPLMMLIDPDFQPAL